MTDKEPYTSKIKELQGALSSAHEEKVRLATGKVDMVEHQALRQEVESLRKTTKELHQELEQANQQGRLIEDEVEDKNGLIEQLNAELDGLKQALQTAEERRQKAEEDRLQAESRAAVILDKLESDSQGAVVYSSSGKSSALFKGAALGAGACLLVLELVALGMGGSELFSRLLAGPRPPSVTPPQPIAQSAPPPRPSPNPAARRPKPKPATGPVEQQVEAAQSEDLDPIKVRSDGNRIHEDPEAGYALVALQGGSFMMGNRTGVIVEESPYHEVSLKPYLIGRSEVSFALYDRFAQATGRPLPDDNGWGRGSMPVINVSWEDAQALARWLSQRTGKNYRLPTEAEWEYAAGGGRESPYWWGYEPGKNNANCFNCNSQYDRRSPAPVETFKVNPFGLHSTAGNVQEWVQDCYRKGYLDAAADGSALEFAGCDQRVVRGGAFNKPADSMKLTRRSSSPASNQVAHLGIRLARDPD
ncbi:MAG: SUMF1/EgtB/PvdO family nonheme iron enzyme [Gammaproteobacteria bacterium SHHR-1]|uniref:formylglycine-generating enzyme family protein n=1 Tax=Magnetovirga frankeli TaxID=947516 RepID=UPI0012932B79|nr:SUMF1/EgtB/PvdO family nonheme iron enzyme [gamma proteobacterium SS-5]